MKSAHHIFSMRRVHMGHLSTRASSRMYMYVVSAIIPCLPVNLSPSQSYDQHSHCGISETRGVFDEERSSYFLHAPSSHGPPFNTCKPRIYMYDVSVKIPCLPLNLSPSQSYYQHGHNNTSDAG
jgi:hypothetical protein